MNQQLQLNPVHAVSRLDMEPCAGNPSAPHVGPQADALVQGFDDRWRCPACQALHVELVMRQAGETDPETIASAVQARPASQAQVDLHRSAAERLVRRVHSNRETSMVFDMTNAETVKEMRAFEAQAPQKVGETNRERAHRLQAAFREKMRARKAKQRR